MHHSDTGSYPVPDQGHLSDALPNADTITLPDQGSDTMPDSNPVSVPDQDAVTMSDQAAAISVPDQAAELHADADRNRDCYRDGN